MLFSVVVPVYNVENYLANCIESILKQSFIDFEIILINDGSKDKSLDICNEYAKKDKRIRVIDQENKGISITRYIGANAAKGEYLVSVDSDDYIDQGYLEFFADIIAKHHPDIVCTNHYIDESQLISNPNFNESLLDKEDIKRIIYPYLITGADYSYFIPTVWGKAIKTELFKKHAYDYPIKVGDDICIVVPAIYDAESIYLSPKAFYHYRSNNVSIMKTKKPRVYDDVYKIDEHFRKNIDITISDFKVQLARLVCHLFFNCSITQFYADKKYKEIKQIIAKELENPVIKEAISLANSTSFKGRIMLFALKHRSYFLMKLYSKVM